MNKIILWLLIILSFFFCSRSFVDIELKNDAKDFFLNKIKNKTLRNASLDLLGSKQKLGVSVNGNISKDFYNCAPQIQATLKMNTVYFNTKPVLNSYFTVYLNGTVTANEDLKEVVIVIYMDSAQINTETLPKTDVLNAGNQFQFVYNSFLPSYLSKGNFSIEFTIHNVNLENLGCTGVNFPIA